MVPSQRTATAAIGHGKKAALNINAWLNQTTFQPVPKHEIVNSAMMNTWYYSDAPRTFKPILNLVRRVSGFVEVVGNLDENNAAYEARHACPLATVSSVITAMASVQKMPFPNWARVYVLNSNMITVKDAACVP